jgi:hypothetical protein
MGYVVRIWHYGAPVGTRLIPCAPDRQDEI